MWPKTSKLGAFLSQSSEAIMATPAAGWSPVPLQSAAIWLLLFSLKAD
jgi:hypothetical protein